MIRVTMTSSFVVAAVQGASGGLVYWILGLPSPLFWGALMSLLSLLPVLGAWLVWGPMAVVLLFSGHTGKGIALLVLGTLLVSGVDNVLRPALIAGRAQMNGLLIFISLLGGVAAFGFLGIILGPVLVATFVGLLKGYHESLNVT
jgi:predicted PurR-regulated permease PerM